MVYQDIGQHISHQFDEDLESLRSKVLNMGGLVEKQVENALIALTRSDSSLAEDVATSDYKINSMEVAIDEECTQVIAKRQPAASDLRLVVTMIKTITDLEAVDGYPTLLISKEKQEPIVYNGNRTKEDIIKFMINSYLRFKTGTQLVSLLLKST